MFQNAGLTEANTPFAGCKMYRDKLATEISYVLNMPVRYRHGKASTIVRAVLDSVANALHRGERVKIPGFGVFFIRERRATRRRCYYFYGRKQKGLYTKIELLPAKKRVVFKPSKVLIKLINEKESL